MVVTMNDQKVLEERGIKYGPTKPMWETIEAIQRKQFKFLLQKCGVRKPTRKELGQLAALNMTVVKSIRSIQDPRDLDHGVDGRNYYYNRGEGCGKNFSIII
jgi:hypothetical protein